MAMQRFFNARPSQIFSSLLIAATTSFSCATFAAPQCLPVKLQCEHLDNPIGVDNAHPRFSWQLQDARLGAQQQAYQLFVSTDSAALDQANTWQSGKISGNITLLTYAGKPLQPQTRYYWKVSVWDKDGIKSTSTTNAFETGMMQASNWKGAWISDKDDVNLKPAAYFRKEVSVNKKIKFARAYVAAAGLFELSINGQRVGDHYLDPMYTRFDRRTLYVVHDVTASLQQGKNAIGMLMGNGWYNHQSTAVWFFDKAPWRGRPTFCMDIKITYEDGSTETVSSGKDWKTSLSPVTFNSIYTAEHYDARLQQRGWDSPGFDASKWKDVIYRAAPSNNIVSQMMYPVKHVEEIPSASLKKLNDTTYVFDLGRNIAGVSHIAVQGEAGTVISLRHAERLKDDGHVDQSNIDVHYRPKDNTDPFQTDIFILSGNGEETFEPRFNYKGFQYVEVTSSKPITLTQQSLKGYFMHSAVPAIGTVSTSNQMMNKLWWATNNSYLSNLFGYPTDCPQREKNGWTGDAHIANETGLYNFDGITIYEKWLADHRDEQQPNGTLPSIIPTGGWGYEWGNGPDWTSTIAIIPWNIYLFYGDEKLLRDCYDNIKRYVDRITAVSPTGLTTWGLGDWVPVKSKSPVELTSTVYYFVDATILAKAAKLLNKTEDYNTYNKLAEKIKRAFNEKYLNQLSGIYGKGTQTELSAPLHWGLAPANLKAKIAANLAERVKQDSFHLDVGLLGTKTILNALSENGYADAAYKIAGQETFPSWGWWIVNGATTLYENWPIDAKSDISRNHIMFGEIGAWMYKGLGGIFPDESKPGFKNVWLQPNFVTGLDSFTASHDAPGGRITSSWKKNGNAVNYNVVIPANTTATLVLDLSNNKTLYNEGKAVSAIGKDERGLSRLSLVAGTYHFEIK